MKTRTSVLLFTVLLLVSSFSITIYADNNAFYSVIDDEYIKIITDATVRNALQIAIFEKPKQNSKVLTKVTCRDYFKVVDQIDEWFEVNYKGISGYINWKYVSFVEETLWDNSNLIGNSTINYISSKNRDTNINIASNIINGYILKPNEEFRWSTVIGNTSAEKGYKPATVIENRKYTQALGGGVCQVSTTIYNALLDTKIPKNAIEVRKHSLGSAYAKDDATVAYGEQDFAFTNTYSFPIKLECYSYKGTVFVNIRKVEY